MDEDDEVVTDIREQIFHNTVREQIVSFCYWLRCCSISIFLYVSFVCIKTCACYLLINWCRKFSFDCLYYLLNANDFN